MENWKDIKGYEGHYQVSNLGRVKSLKYKNHRILKEHVSGKSPYKHVSLCINNKLKTFDIHKLVAISFLNHSSSGQNINGETIIVDHIDENKHNNNLNNLRERTFRGNVSGNNPGVYKTKNGRFQVRIQVNKKRIYLGVVDTIKEGNNLYNNALKNINYFNGDVNEFRKKINEN